MSVNINPGFFGGLAAIAGNPVPNLNLKTAPIESGKLLEGLAQGNRFNATMGLEQQKLSEDARQRDMANTVDTQRTAIMQQNADTQRQESQAQTALRDMQTRALQSKETLEKQGAYAAMYMTGFQTIKDPKQLKEFTQAYLTRGVKDGIISQDEAEQLIKLPPQQVYANAQYHLLISDKAKDYQAMMKANQQPGQTGNITVTQPDGTVVNVQASQQQYSKSRSKQLVEQEKTYFEDSQKAAERKQGLVNLQEGSDMFGQGGPIVSAVKKGVTGFATGVGLGDVAGAREVSTGAQIMDSEVFKLARQSRVAGEGQMSDADLKILVSQQPNKDMNKQARDNMIKMLNVPNDLKILKYDTSQAWLEKSNSLDGFEKAWNSVAPKQNYFIKDKQGNYTIDEAKLKSIPDAVLNKQVVEDETRSTKEPTSYTSVNSGKSFTLHEIDAHAEANNMTREEVIQGLNTKKSGAK